MAVDPKTALRNIIADRIIADRVIAMAVDSPDIPWPTEDTP